MSLAQLVRYSVRTVQQGQVGRWQPHRIQRLQRRRLAQLLRTAINLSPFYARKYQRLDLSKTPFRELPPTNKRELMENFNQVVTDPQISRKEVERYLSDPANLGRWFRGRYAVSHTSGSQGQPLLIVQDRRALEILFATMAARGDVAGRPGLAEGVRRLRVPKRIAVVAVQRGFYPSGAAFEFMPEIVGPYVNLQRFAAEQPDLFERLNDFQPQVLVGYASVLEALAARRDALRLEHLRQISNSSEQLLSSARERISQAFGVPVFDHYGMGECLQLADACPTDGGVHVNADWAIVEIVDDEYRPVPPGQIGRKILVTNLANHVQPFIRYEVPDCVAWATTHCRCGSHLPRIDQIEGRASEVFWVQDRQGPRMLSGALFHNAVDALGLAREWQAIQQETNRVDIRLVLDGDLSISYQGLRQLLRCNLLQMGLPPEVQTDVTLVPSIGCDPRTGKRRRMISRVAQDPKKKLIERVARATEGTLLLDSHH
ncbi:MAG: phenylacetate--CoA ligase family protein [Pirellulales bacterium]|nr:phenylacetate--CoA ligase family protein [Pirellulales bacterium]